MNPICRVRRPVCAKTLHENGQIACLDISEACGAQKRRPFEVPSEVLNPTLCLSSVGVNTGKSFSPALISPGKVHTSLLSMLIANEMTEDMIAELLGTGNAAPLMNSLLQPGEHAQHPISWPLMLGHGRLISRIKITAILVEQPTRQPCRESSSTSHQQPLV